MGVYQRPPRSDELYHWGRGSVSSNHKYIAKIGNRYFYTPEELKAFKQGVSGAGQRVSDNFSKLRSAVYDRAGGAAKRRAQASAQRANVLKTNVATTRQAATNANNTYKLARDMRDAQRDVITGKKDRATVSFKDSEIQRDRKKYGHSDGYKEKADVITYDLHGEKISPNRKNNTMVQTNKETDEYRDNANKKSDEHRATRIAAQNAQKQADRDKAAYDKTLLGRAEAAKKNVVSGVESAKKDISKRVESTGNAIRSKAPGVAKKAYASAIEGGFNANPGTRGLGTMARSAVVSAKAVHDVKKEHPNASPQERAMYATEKVLDHYTNGKYSKIKKQRDEQAKKAQTQQENNIKDDALKREERKRNLYEHNLKRKKDAEDYESLKERRHLLKEISDYHRRNPWAGPHPNEYLLKQDNNFAEMQVVTNKKKKRH